MPFVMPSLSVLTLNVLFGGEDRFPALVSLLQRVNPDLLVLQECLGWEHDGRFDAMAKALKVPDIAPHAYLGQARPRGSGKRYHVAVFSKRPFRGQKTYADPSFIGHAIVELTIDTEAGPLHVFGTHGDSHHENLRFVEARYLAALIDPGDFQRGLYLLAGDLNSLSRKDPYPPDLAERVKRAGVDKYGHPPRFEVTDELERFGWRDALYEKGSPANWVTARRDRGGEVIDYRTDYVFTSPPLAARLSSCEIVPVNGSSDHEGVLAKFQL